MRTRFTWILGVGVLISIGFLVACSTKYTSSSNGLIVVSTQASAVMDSFSLNLGNGQIARINNAAGPPTSGVPTTVLLAPGGSYAYVLLTQTATIAGSVTGIATYQVASDGKLSAVGNPVGLAPEVITLPNLTTETVPATPATMAIDSTGQFLFVADTSTVDSSGNPVPGAVSVFAAGSGGSVTELAGSPFVLPVGGVNVVPPTLCVSSVPCSSASAVAVTPTVYPPAYSACSANVPPSSENVYVTDSLNYLVLNYSVSSTGALTLVQPTPSTAGVPTGTVPSGVTVDPCNRFVYVSNAQPNNSVSAYKICSAVNLPTCTQADFSLLSAGPTITAGTNPGQLLVDPFGSFLYVVDRGQNAISGYKIGTVTGGLTPLNPATISTNGFPTSIAIRSDDTWMFVTNLNQSNVSQYAITPSNGALITQSPIPTDGDPWGVAVK